MFIFEPIENTEFIFLDINPLADIYVQRIESTG